MWNRQNYKQLVTLKIPSVEDSVNDAVVTSPSVVESIVNILSVVDVNPVTENRKMLLVYVS